MADRCELCRGTKGAVLGNENRVAGVVICDYCYVECAPLVKRAANLENGLRQALVYVFGPERADLERLLGD